MPRYDFVCPNGHELIDYVKSVNDPKPTCKCGEPMSTLWRGTSQTVIGDDIPGGIEIRHGICNPDGTPKRYYTKSSIHAAAKAAGLQVSDQHLPKPGTDKDPYHKRWF